MGMNQDAPIILMVEDSESLGAMYKSFLANTNYVIHHATSLQQAFSLLDKFLPDIILLDLMLPDGDGMELLSFISGYNIPVDVVIMTAYGSIESCVNAMQKGAKDFITKPFPATRLQVTLHNLLYQRNLSKTIDTFRDDFGAYILEGIKGNSLAIQSIFKLITTAASADVPVMITGEMGTGKKTCAEAIHKRSQRKNMPVEIFNCAEESFQSQAESLFGKSSKWFMGAGAHNGLLQRLHGGTLILHNIDCLSIFLQQQIMTYLQSQKYSPTNKRKKKTADVRIIGTLATPTGVKTFDGTSLPIQPELYYKLSTLHLHMPALREREADILDITEPMLKEIAMDHGKAFIDLSNDVKGIFLEYAWPGNIQQLRQVLESIVVTHTGTTVTPEMLPELFDKVKKTAKARHNIIGTRIITNDNIKPLWQIERLAIEQTLNVCDGDIQAAANLLQVSPSRLFQKRRQWESA